MLSSHVATISVQIQCETATTGQPLHHHLPPPSLPHSLGWPQHWQHNGCGSCRHAGGHHTTADWTAAQTSTGVCQDRAEGLKEKGEGQEGRGGERKKGRGEGGGKEEGEREGKGGKSTLAHPF